MRTRHENHRAIFVLLFLNVAFFFLEYSNGARYQELFSFSREAVLRGELWRLFTFQFMQGGLLSFFFNMLILYLMGDALEEEWGTFDLIVFFMISALGSAAVAFVLDVPLLGSFFLAYSLLFAYAHTYPEQTFYIFFILPVRVKWLAWIAAALLGYGVAMRISTSLAAAAGAILSFGYYWYFLRTRRYRVVKPRIALTPAAAPQPVEEGLAEGNLKLYNELRKAIEEGSAEKKLALQRALELRVVRGVNICPPADYKPLNEDQYCVRCEGFAECSLRYLKLSEEKREAAKTPVLKPEVT